jgi:hypothetical protein
MFPAVGKTLLQVYQGERRVLVVCTSVGVLPLGESPIAATNHGG